MGFLKIGLPASRQQTCLGFHGKIRTETFAQLDLAVLRFSNSEIDREFAQVRKKIEETVRERLHA